MPPSLGTVCKFYFISSIVLFTTPIRTMSSGQAIWRCDFEVFGVVQGVFFRKYTQGQANKLGIKGWCQNSPKGTVIGVIEGEESNFKLMKDWLSRTGSPSSRIDKAEWKNEKKIDNFTFSDFSIKR